MAIGQLHPPLPEVQGGHLRLQNQINALLAIEVVGSKRNPIFLGAACQIVLRQIRPIARRRLICAHHRQRPIVSFTPQRLSRGKARSAAADNHD